MKISRTSKRYRLFLILAIGLLSVLFFIGGPDFNSPRSFRAAWNMGHIIYFALLPLFILTFIPKKQFKPGTQAIFIVAITLIFGTLVEFFQYGLHRSPDMGDLLRNMIGASIAIFFLIPLRFPIPGRILLSIKIAIMVLATAQCQPIVVALVDEHHARRDFPILSDFQTPFQIHRWLNSAEISISDAVGQPGNNAMQVDLTTDRYSGVRLKYFPGNWQEYHWLQVRIYNPSTVSISIICRIFDATHSKAKRRFGTKDRFNSVYTISRGWNTITISLDDIRQAPESRDMNMRQVHDIGFFSSSLSHPRVIFIDDLKLI